LCDGDRDIIIGIGLPVLTFT
jgi:hypothetical protein